MTINPFGNKSYVEIDGGIVQSATVTDHKGTRPCLTHIGSFRYFVDVVEADGGRFGMWDGATYDEALRQADLLSMDFGPVRDRIDGGAR